MLLSIIIPVYNIEDYIVDCLESVLAITDVDYEVIIVLGESTDNSNTLVERYAKQNKNVILTFQDGKGLSNARNCGMNFVQGEFVIFLDGDDYIEADKLVSALSFLKKSGFDVLVSEYKKIYNLNKKFFLSKQIANINNSDGFDKNIFKFLKKKKCFWNVWRYIYRYAFLLNNKLSFTEGIYAEDLDYTTEIFLKTNKIYFYNDSYYFYRANRKNSLMNIPTKKKLMETVNVIENNIEKLYRNNYKYKNIFYKQYIFELFLNTAILYEIKKNERNELKSFFIKKEKIYNIDNYIIAKILKIFDVKIIAFFLYIVKKIKYKIIN